MGSAIASFDFEFPTWRFNDKEVDRSKTTWFKEGEELPLPLVLILERGNQEYVSYLDGKSGRVDVAKPNTGKIHKKAVPKKVDAIVRKKQPKPKQYTEKEAYSLNKKEQIDLLTKRGVEKIGRIEKQRVEQILETN
jgi:hypothetical protein|tara:strand:+ start:8761 stop:9168 length:408 start_codon:yes stop_codon:yes gene_type:complete